MTSLNETSIDLEVYTYAKWWHEGMLRLHPGHKLADSYATWLKFKADNGASWRKRYNAIFHTASSTFAIRPKRVKNLRSCIAPVAELASRRR